MFAGDIGMSCEERTCAAPVQHTTEKPLLAWIQSQFLADFNQYLTRLALERQHIARAHGGFYHCKARANKQVSSHPEFTIKPRKKPVEVS